MGKRNGTSNNIKAKKDVLVIENYEKYTGMKQKICENMKELMLKYLMKRCNFNWDSEGSEVNKTQHYKIKANFTALEQRYKMSCPQLNCHKDVHEGIGADKQRAQPEQPQVGSS